MPNSKCNHGGQRRMVSIEEKSGGRGGSGRVRSITGKASSFHEWGTTEGAVVEARLMRPKTVNDIGRGTDERPRLPMKLLLNVSLQGSLGPVHVVMRLDSTVGDLITMSVSQYIKEGRRPVPPTKDPFAFDLHYSQFSLESLHRDEKLMNLGSRNFFLCKRRVDVTRLPERCCNVLSCSSSETPTNSVLQWMDFLL